MPGIVEKAMDKLGGLVGRHYKLFDYYGAADAERVVILMGSGVDVARDTVAHLNAHGEKVGVIAVRLYRPFSADAPARRRCLPHVKAVAMLDRTKEPGATGEPLYLDVVGALAQAVAARQARRHAARHRRPLRPVLEGLRSGPGQGRVSTNSRSPSPKNSFTVGINDDVTHHQP